MPYLNLERGRGRWGQTGAVAIVVATGVTISAQQTPPPNPLGQPLLDAAGVLRDDAFIRIPLRPDDRRYAGIDGARMKAQLLDVDAISLADRDTGNLFWGRNVGTAGHVATQDWVEGHFRRNGLEHVHRQGFDLLPQWNLEAWDITFASGRETFSLASARPPQDAASTPEDGHTFELVWIGGGSDADYLGRDVTGKAVLIQDIPRPGTLRHSIRDEDSVARAFEKGRRPSASSMASPTTSRSGSEPATGRGSISATTTAGGCAIGWAGRAGHRDAVGREPDGVRSPRGECLGHVAGRE